jgi:wyosine [tRNA(Phe)-imidazoG37] synthetase (radical SAM superfamily)
MKDKKYLFGPVPSRRLGLSLGVDLLGPGKHCNLNCVYCELGKSGSLNNERKVFVKTDDVLAQIKDFFAEGGEADVITISGAGEPGLALNLGEVIDGIRSISDKKIAILTNGLMFCEQDVFSAMAKADMVLPSLDAASIEVFEKINRPTSDIKFYEVIDRIKEFGREYKGELLIEVLFVAGINDSDDEIAKLKRLIDSIPNVKAIQVNTVVRSGAEDNAKAISDEKLAQIANVFGDKANVIGSFSGSKVKGDDIEEVIYSAIRLRPVSVEDLINMTGQGEEQVCEAINTLQSQGKIEKKILDTKEFFQGK